KTPHHFYCTDMMPDLGIASGMVNNKFIIKLSRIVEKLVYNNSTAVYAVTPLMAENIKEKSSNKNIFVLSDWVGVEFFNKNRYKYVSDLENKYDLNGKKVILYIGNIGFLQNLRTVVEVAKRMDRDEEYSEYIFVIGGAGAQKAELENECKKHGLKNIRFIGVVDRQHVPSFLELSSYTLMNFVNHPHMALYRSSKIFDYIMAEKPVIVGATGELAKIVEENNLGVVACPSDPEDFYSKLIKLISTKYEINNEHLIKKYSKDNVLSEFYKKIQCSNE
ncbi:Glycosyltransferase involved in cell wall bisynthesis, partial [Candidatus Methanophagaceae archaeon]